MGALLDLIPGGWLAAAGAFAATLIGVAWKAFSAGKNRERAKHDREKVEAHEREMERVDKASKARADAGRKSGDDGLRDEWSRD